MLSIAVGMPGPFELIIILAIILILFGPGKLPKVLAQMGKGVKAFKEGLSGTGKDDDTVDITPDEEPPKAIDEMEEEAVQAPSEDAEEVASTNTEDTEDTENQA